MKLPARGEPAPNTIEYYKYIIGLNEAVMITDAKEIDGARREARTLAAHIYDKHYKKDSPHFKLLDNTSGVISQIDNMVAGLDTKLDSANSEIDRLKHKVNQLEQGGFAEGRCREYMAFVHSDEFHPDKMGGYENAIFEAAMTQVFGIDIFDEINSRMD